MEHEHIVIRKPFTFFIIVMLILIALYILIRLYVIDEWPDHEPRMIEESYNETWARFSSESDLNPSEKRELFKITYKGNNIRWQGKMLECAKLDNGFLVRVDHRGSEFADVSFTTTESCTGFEKGDEIDYSMELDDLQINVFIGVKGEIWTG